MAGRIDSISTFKIFVKNLSPLTSEEELKAVFESCGRVVQCEIFKPTMAFVHMEDEECGRNAILMLNARLINEKCIGVEESKHKGRPGVSSTRLRVKNVPLTMSAKGIRDLFGKYGLILSVEINNDEAIVTIEAIADIRSALTEMNGYNSGEADSTPFIVEPIINTDISYKPKERQPHQAFAPPPLRQFRPRGPNNMGLRVRPPAPPNFYPDNPEGRVLRDPYAHPPRPRPPRHCRPQMPFGVPRPTTTSIEPLFFKRNEFGHNSGLPPPPPPQYYDDSYETPVAIDPWANNLPPPPPTLARFRPNAPRPHFHQPRFPVKRHVSDFEAGEPFQVPGMIRPDEFVPPRKYFANMNRPKKKKKKNVDKPQPPIPEPVSQKPVPLFPPSHYLPVGSVLTPYPAPNMNKNEDFTEDVSNYRKF